MEIAIWNGMQAFETKYIGPTDHRGSRIKAACERGSITVGYDDALNSEANHIAAVDALVARFVAEDLQNYGTPPEKNPWALRRVIGATPSNRNGYVHVYAH